MEKALSLPNAAACPVTHVPVLPMEALRREILSALGDGGELAALFARPAGSSRQPKLILFAILADRAAGRLRLSAAELGASWPSLTPDCPAASWFEREIAEQWGVVPQGHPWLKPLRFTAPRAEVRGASKARSASKARGAARPADVPKIGDAAFFRVEGEEVHEVAVGPVHAGVIEPGHFRFQCHGETVLHLEISLGYQHRGVEQALVGGPDLRSVHYAETLAGDTSIGHATAYCQAVEALAGCQAPPRALAIRAIALELERVANHVGDLGALAGDVGFLPTASWCGRIRGDVLNLSAAVCGSRFGRGLVRPGGVAFDIDARLAGELRERLATCAREAAGACELLWRTPSVLARFEGTGALTRAQAAEIGLTGPAARASGIDADARRDFPAGMWMFAQVPVSTWRTGDVFARAYVRWLETQRSLAFIEAELAALPPGEIRVPVRAAARGAMAASIVEGWRGAICHVASTGSTGRFAHYKVVDPSFRNWLGLAIAMRGGEVSDFPLCNKSFDLSYCGHDL